VTEVEPPFCFQCGMPFSGVSRERAWICGRCLTDPPPFTRARYAVEYAGSLREGIGHFKYSGKLYLTRALSALLIEAFHRHFHRTEFDVILPVPIHRNRLVKRGFNQAVILADRLSDATGIPVHRTALQKIKDTRPQVGLPRAERATNLRGSFGVAHGRIVRGKNILMVDDVVTTGSTIGEAARTLLAEGASKVDALVLAVKKSGPELITPCNQPWKDDLG
jgi:ComF family protein